MPYAVFVKERLVLHDEVTNRRRGLSGDCLDIVREAIISVSRVEAGHGQEVFKEILGQTVLAQFLVMPLIERRIDAGNSGPRDR